MTVSAVVLQKLIEEYGEIRIRKEFVGDIEQFNKPSATIMINQDKN